GNRLRTVTSGSTIVESYRYDAYGRRALSFAPSGNLLSFYDQAGQLMYQRDLRQGKLLNYIYLGGSLVAIADQALWGGTITAKRYQHTDALGTPVAVTDENRNVIERSEYEPYGQLLNRAQHDGPGFTGHVQDALTGLTYMQQRYYDPTIGRFLSVDPVTALSNPVGMFNRYDYAANNPYRFTDPDGRATVCANGTCVMTADTFDPAHSNGQTTLASTELRAKVESTKWKAKSEGLVENSYYVVGDGAGGLKTFTPSNVGPASLS
ncbi:MAG TPA: RHS repeat-associated core domain-containing protein, partial [Bordetella sp.]|uniref:RHS repeat-associated core domain-containing protein n=1 Tax=Bordetella sp. TaxID=28081 RepID=UPI002ED5AE2E